MIKPLSHKPKILKELINKKPKFAGITTNVIRYKETIELP